MNRITSLLLLLTIAIVFSVSMSSCEKESLENNSQKTTTTSISQEGMMVLGNKLDNPYTLENMQSALDLLQQENGFPSITLQASHYYVRFLPKTLEEYNLIHDESVGLILFDHPLDYEIIVEGNYYQDPEFIGKDYTWQYTVVPVDFNFPNGVFYEIIDNAFIPDESNMWNTENGLDNGQLELLIEKAHLITNNSEEEGGQKTTASWWTPTATIIALDNTGLQLLPTSNSTPHTLAPNGYTYVEGIKVTAYHFFKLSKGFTNNVGFATMNKNYKYKVRYRLIFKTDRFRIAYILPFIQQKMVGPKKRGHWNPFINWINSELDIKSTMMFMAAYDFIHRPQIRFPINNPYSGSTLFPTTLVIDNGLEDAASHAILGAFNIVWRYTEGENTTSRVYRTTIHELGHLAHKMAVPFRYDDFILNWLINESKQALGESWAEGVEWYIADQKYVYTNLSYGQRTRIHNPNTGDVETYTQLVRDLIDTFNENFIIWNSQLTEIQLPYKSYYIIEKGKLFYSPGPGGTCPVPGSQLVGTKCYLEDLPPMYDFEIWNTSTGHQHIQFTVPDPNSDLPFDPVSGYSMAEIQQALHQSRDWHEWRQNLEQISNNPDNPKLLQFFNQWF